MIKKIAQVLISLNILRSYVYNVKDYGAKGDGVTDDTAAIQRAQDAAALVSGTVEFPHGTYIVSATIGGFANGQNWFGYGACLKRKDSSALTHSPASASYSYGFSPNNAQMIDIRASRVAIYGLELDGNKANNSPAANDQGDGIELVGATECVIEDCYLHDFARDAVTAGQNPDTLASADDNLVSKCRILRIGLRDNINGGNGFAVTYGSRNTLANCKLSGDASNASNAVAAIDFEPNSTSDIVSFNLAIGNTIDSVRISQAMACYTGSISGSYPSFSNSFIGNTVTCSDPAKEGLYAFQGRNCKGLIFEGNNLRYGSQFSAKIGGQNEDCIIKGNVFRDSDGIGLSLPDRAERCLIEGNIIHGCALEGIQTNAGNHVTIKGNHIYDGGGAAYDGISSGGHSHINIEGNIVYSYGGNGIKIFACKYAQILGNHAIDCGLGAHNSFSSIVSSGSSDYVKISKNVVGSQFATATKVKYCIEDTGSLTEGAIWLENNSYLSAATSLTQLGTAYASQWMDENYMSRQTLNQVAGGYVSAISGDLGKPVVGATSGTRGTLISYNNTTRDWVAAAVGQFTAGETLSITGGTGAGVNNTVVVSNYNTTHEFRSRYTITYGIGTPEGSVVARPGSQHISVGGGYGKTFWFKEKNTTANGWQASLSMGGSTPTDAYIPYGKVSGSDAYLAQKNTFCFNESTNVFSVRNASTATKGVFISEEGIVINRNGGAGYFLFQDGSGSDDFTIQRQAGGGLLFGTATTQKQALWGKTPIVQPAHANQAAVVLGNSDSEIGGLAISAAYSQAEVQALRDKCEELADDVRALGSLVDAMRTAMVDYGSMKGSA